MRGAAPIALYGNSTLGTFVTTHWTLEHPSDPNERLDHFCLAPHVAMRVGLYLLLVPELNPTRAPRTVSEDPASTCSIFLDRCLPLAFMPYASRTRRSNPTSSDAPSSASTARSRQMPGSRSAFTTSGNRSKNGSTAALQVRQPPDRKGQNAAVWAFRANLPAAEDLEPSLRESLDGLGVGRSWKTGSSCHPPCLCIIELR